MRIIMLCVKQKKRPLLTHGDEEQRAVHDFAVDIGFLRIIDRS